MRNYSMDWTEVYDKNRIVAGAGLSESCAPLSVDVGGMHGLDTSRLLSKHPELLHHTKIVVQDLPEVVDACSGKQLDPQGGRISTIAYELFTPQSLVGARTYFFHEVPYDWPDAECNFKTFNNVKAAIKKGYSKLLIYEIVILATGASASIKTLDLQVMSLVSGLERTEEYWSDLLAGVGLSIVNISWHPRASESGIEAELA